MEVWTISLSQWRVAKERGIFLLDTTAMSGVKVFAPDFNLVKMYKRGEITEEVYTAFYHEKMAQSQIENKKYWDHLEKRSPLALACYCRAGVFCHRHLLLKLVQDYYATKGVEVKYMGEITKEKKG